MSDFLSNFVKKNYKETKEKKGQVDSFQEKNDKQEKEPKTSYDRLVEKAGTNTKRREPAIGPRNIADKELNSSESESTIEEPLPTRRSQLEEEVETDPTYYKKRKRKFTIIGLGVILGLCLLFFTYYQMTHVKVPDFTGKEISDVRTWATANKVKIKLEQSYDLKKEANKIISQKQKADTKIKKGSDLTIEASLGPDPEEKIPLPNFMEMSKADVEKWLKEKQATNITVIQEYNDSIEKGKPIKFEMVTKDVTNDSYKRKDKAKMFYSKGKETFEKNIVVPDFSKKPKSEVESWAKTNSINVTYEEDSSSDILQDSIISQSIAKDEKIAKKENMTVVVSLGKGFEVPNFAEYTPEEAATAVEGLKILAKSVYTVDVPYGQLVSQSLEAGTKLTSKDDLTVKVYYSAGQPYLKDLRGSTVEGDLQKIFYDEYRAKGANIRYVVNYVDSAEPKGTVVGMSAHSIYVPLDYTVTISISLGNLGSGAPAPPDKQTGGEKPELD